MHDAPTTVGGVLSPRLLFRLSEFLAVVLVLTLFGGAACRGTGTPEQQATQQKKTLSADEFKALKQNAERGDTMAQCGLGHVYRLGLGVPQDYEQAVAWFRKAADQGEASSQYNLGLMYDKGQGVQQDYAQAVAWYRKAADQGVARAQNDLGLMCAKGQGVSQDYAQAVAWWRKAADQGHAMAQQNLGVAYAFKRSVPHDHIEAYKWMTLAASRSSGDEQRAFAAQRDGFAQGMTPAEIAEAQKRAREWMVTFEKRKK